ncbi:NAD(+)/NADH kinase [Salinibacterium sp. G-O1]|uniref:ATP-NAD kinase family protein n=1 Tax=Salinibacterium sp. G-O1 TaxID=3046208 RepID=UPI0024BAADD9|nr:NAD(+)/NADH kinase [Salinibacterium sp. G-O1]MDJ0333607.1 NAD(+)/NADH kinase [Salinibacterium sp. G-O1]
MTRSIGLLINPVAGIGGPAGLKGSDGIVVQATARERGARQNARERALLALQVLATRHPAAEIITADGAMGADAVRLSGLRPQVVYRPAGAAATTGADTTAATAALVDAGASLILFVGGDGTARDVAAGLGAEQPVVGVPAGVKMYSSCFAVSPAAAGALAAQWAEGALPLEQREILDVDEDQIREGRVDPRLFAMVPVPFIAGRTQSRKSATPASDAAAVRVAAAGAIARMTPGWLYLLGPGGTMMEVARQLGVPKTPLGVDVVRFEGAAGNACTLLLADASEKQLLELIATFTRARPTESTLRIRAVVTVIGGQGFLLGRGNQQISGRVIEALGTDPLLVVATEGKLANLAGRPLLVDTGSRDVDLRLSGHISVITGARSSGVYPVTAPQ